MTALVASRPLRVAVATLGCRLNQYDGAVLETALRGRCEVVPFAAGADVYVVNSCSVTDHADAESRQLARRARRLNPAGRVVLTGCFAQTGGARAAIAEVDHVVGVGRLPDLLRAVHGELAADERVLVGSLRRAEQVGLFGAEAFPGQTRASLKIQEGCDLFCSFCIVPTARGRSRSVAPRLVLDELARLAAAGFREVVLTGIHLGGYGRDLRPALTLADLVEAIAAAAPLPRVRLSSIDPPEVTPRLLGLMAQSAVLCPHLHVPVQAGADGVLRRMRRQYETALVRDVAAEVARVLPAAALGTDVIAGFPGEGEADAEATRTLLADCGFSYLHVFSYSRRRGTTAAKAADQVPAATIATRARALRQLGAAQRRAFAARCAGRELRVLIERGRDAASGLRVGYSREYARVLVDGAALAVNEEVRVRGVAARGERVLGVALADDDGLAAG